MTGKVEQRKRAGVTSDKGSVQSFEVKNVASVSELMSEKLNLLNMKCAGICLACWRVIDR